MECNDVNPMCDLCLLSRLCRFCEWQVPHSAAKASPPAVAPAPVDKAPIAAEVSYGGGKSFSGGNSDRTVLRRGLEVGHQRWRGMGRGVATDAFSGAWLKGSGASPGLFLGGAQGAEQGAGLIWGSGPCGGSDHATPPVPCHRIWSRGTSS